MRSTCGQFFLGQFHHFSLASRESGLGLSHFGCFGRGATALLFVSLRSEVILASAKFLQKFATDKSLADAIQMGVRA